MNKQTELTDAQAAVLKYIKAYQAEHQGAPTRAEISAHFGWASANAAEEHLRALERKSCIKLRPVARGIFVL